MNAICHNFELVICEDNNDLLDRVRVIIYHYPEGKLQIKDVCEAHDINVLNEWIKENYPKSAYNNTI